MPEEVRVADGRERRRFPRVSLELKVGYELAHWKEDDPAAVHHPVYVRTRDVSLGGVGLADVIHIDRHAFHQLLTGKRKVRLEIHLPGREEPLYCFARLVWGHEPEGDVVKRAGFAFIDVSPLFFHELSSFIEAHLSGKSSQGGRQASGE